MGVVNKAYVTINVNGISYKVSPLLISTISLIKRDIKKKWDSIILITGDVGSGKSTIAKILAGIYQQLRNEDLTIDNFTWSSEGLVAFTDREDNYEAPIIYDEAIQGGTGRDSITKSGKQLIEALVTKRRKKHLTIVIIDQLQEFNRKFIARCSYLIDCRTMVEDYQKKRGFFKVYSKKETLEIYSLLKKGIIGDIKMYRAYQKHFYRFWDCENIFLNEEEYENQKITETKALFEEKGKIAWSPEKMQGFYLWAKGGMKQFQIADQIGITAATFSNWAKDFRKIKVNCEN